MEIPKSICKKCRHPYHKNERCKRTVATPIPGGRVIGVQCSCLHYEEADEPTS